MMFDACYARAISGVCTRINVGPRPPVLCVLANRAQLVVHTLAATVGLAAPAHVQRDQPMPQARPPSAARTLGGSRDGGHDDHWAGREPGRGSSGGLETDRHLERGQ